MSPLKLSLRLVAGVLLILANGFFVATEFALTRARQFTEDEFVDGNSRLERAQERNAVFEAGYMTTDGQAESGLGLVFVRELAGVYDWEYSVTESSTGQALFKFTNIDHDPEQT